MLKTLNLFLFLPLFFSLLLGILSFIRNPIYIRRICVSIYVFEFILSSMILTFSQDVVFPFLGAEFAMDKFCALLIFATSLVFMLFSIMSKTFITKLHRMFGATSLLLFGLVNIAILSNNIFVILASLFWLFLIFYFLSTSFLKIESKKNIVFQLMSDLFWYLVAIFLIIKDFIRYFVANDIGLDFSSITDYLYKVDDVSIALAFFGFLILIGRLFNFIPFCAKNLSNSTVVNPLVYCMQSFSSLVVGSFLFVKCYLNFNFLFYQFQDEIALFLIANFIVFVILALKQSNMFKFLTNIVSFGLVIGLISVFSFEKECFGTFAYFTLILCVSYVFCAMLFMVLSNKFKTDRFDELKRMNDSSKMFQFFTTISLLNIAGVPLLSFFSAELICFMMIFGTDYDGVVLNIAPYILIVGAFLVSACVFNVLYKILIEPPEKSVQQTLLSSHQVVVFAILTIAIMVMSFCPDYVFAQIGTVVEIGNF